MNRQTAPEPATPNTVPRVPAWALPRGPVETDAEAAYLAGGALNSLDNLVRSEAPWLGAWRHRLALKAAAATVKLLRRTEDEAALRDTWLLSRPGDRLASGEAGSGSTPDGAAGSMSLGPAGNILAAWRHLAATSTSQSASPGLDGAVVQKIVEQLGLRWDEGFAALPAQIEVLLRTHAEQPAPFAAAAMVAKVRYYVANTPNMMMYLHVGAAIITK